MALEALSEYALDMPPPPVTEVDASFTVKGKTTKLELSLGNKADRVETELKVEPQITHTYTITHTHTHTCINLFLSCNLFLSH